MEGTEEDRASRISGRGDRGKARDAGCFQGRQRSIRTRIQRSEISFSVGHPGQLTYLQRATKVAVGTEKTHLMRTDEKELASPATKKTDKECNYSL